MKRQGDDEKKKTEKNKTKRQPQALGITTGLKISFYIRMISIIMAGVISTSQVLPIWAKPKVTVSYSKSYIKEVRNDITDVIESMEEMLTKQYNNARDSVKKEIKANSWDYEYTMQSFDDQGNPYANMDYTSIVSAYTTILEDGNSSFYFYDLPILSVQTYEKDVPGDEERKYGEVEFSLMSANDLFSYFGMNPSDERLMEKFNTRTNLINDVLDGSNLGQNILVKTIENVQSEDTDEDTYSRYIPRGLDEERSAIIQTALTLVGQVPYQWGGKPDGPEYDHSWWTFNEETGTQKGLDCSGFVQWVFMTVGYPEEVTDLLSYTGNIVSNLEEINKDELEPGDIGLMNETQSSMNHTGIYLGNGKWIHCSSSDNTVVVNDGCFKYYRKAPEWNNVDAITPKMYIFNRYSVNVYYTEENEMQGREYDIYLLAKLMQHEAEGEGYNGWAAVGEVVMNRVKSNQFPNTVSEVVFAENQFEGFKESVDTIIPKAEIISCAAAVYAGQVKILGNENVLFFRNPMITDGISASVEKDWGQYKWYCNIGHHAFYRSL